MPARQFSRPAMFVPRLAVCAALACALMASGQQLGAQKGGRGFPPRDARQQPTGSSVIRGRIVAADTGSPLRRAQVRAFSSDTRSSRLATSDGEGRFEFRDLPAGRWELTASKAGFVTLRFGQRRPFEAGTPIELAAAQVMDSANIALPRGAAITGRVYDEFGDPVAGAGVRVLRYQMVQGTRRLVPAGANDQSDDTGAFRLFGLMPGDYYVSATLRALRVDDPSTEAAGYAATYYPGTGNVADAQRVTLGLGQEQANVNFALLPVRTVRITGTAVDSMGRPLGGGIAVLAPADATADTPMMFGSGGAVRGDGSFTLPNVAPGSYTLTVSTRGPGRRGGADAAGEVGLIPLTVGTDDLTGVVVATSPGATLAGTVVAAAGSAPIPSGIEIAAQAFSAGRGFGMPSARVERGAFTLRGLLGSRAIRVNGLPPAWMVESIVVNGEDVTDRVVTFSGNQELRDARITITDRVTELNGTVTNGSAAVKDYSVVVFPEDDTNWAFPTRYVRAARPDQQGAFRIRGLPPDRGYLAVAVDYLEEGEGGDPEFLAQIRNSATRLAIGPGETKSVELRLVTR